MLNANQTLSATFGLGISLLCATGALAHGENDDLTYETIGGQIITHNTIQSLVQIVGPHFGTSQTGADRLIVNSPWFLPGNSVDPADSFTVQFEALRVWNGSGFINPGNETVTLTHANGTLELNSVSATSFGLDYNDTELTWQLNGNDGANDPDRGVYLLEFIIADDDTGDASRPVYFAFDFESGYTPENPSYLSEDYNHHHHHMSREYIFDHFIIPEPSSLALLGMGGLMLLRRRLR